MLRICSLALVALVGGGPLHALPTIPLLRPLEPAPNSIVAAPDGTVYFVDILQQTVWRLGPDGVATPFVTGTSGRSLQIDDSGNIYGTNTEGRGRVVLWRADAQGTMSEVGRGRTPGEAWHVLAAGWGVPRNLMTPRVIDTMTRTRSGEVIVTAGPTVRMVGLDGRVRTIASGGELLDQRSSLIARLVGSPSHLTGVAAAANGDIYVANAARGLVVRVSRDGRMQEVHSAEPGWRPTGVAVAGGVVHVLEYGAGVRVRRLDASGGSRIVALMTPHRSAEAAGIVNSWLPI
jgi:sugar lactone lactonase YvrE